MAYDQAHAFKETVDIGSVVITKLDGHAKVCRSVGCEDVGWWCPVCSCRDWCSHCLHRYR